MKKFFVPCIRDRIEKLNSLLEKSNIVYIYCEPKSGKRELVEEFIEFNLQKQSDLYSFYIDAFCYENIFIDLLKWSKRIRQDKKKEILSGVRMKDKELIRDIQELTDSKCYFIFDNASKKSRLERILKNSNENIKYLILTNEFKWIPINSFKFENKNFNREECSDLIQYELNVQYRLMVDNLEEILKYIFYEETISQDDISYLIRLFNKNPFWTLDDLLKFYSGRFERLKTKRSFSNNGDETISCLSILELLKYSSSDEISYDLLEMLLYSNKQNQFIEDLNYLVENGFLKKNSNSKYHFSKLKEVKDTNDSRSILYSITNSTKEKINGNDEKLEHYLNLIFENKDPSCLEHLKLQNRIIRNNLQFFLDKKSQIKKFTEKLINLKKKFCLNDYNFAYDFFCEYVDLEIKVKNQIDLREIEIDKEMLKYLKEVIISKGKPLKIIWESYSNITKDSQSERMKKKIENHLINNFEIFNFPADEVYSLMCLANFDKKNYMASLENLEWSVLDVPNNEMNFRSDLKYTVFINCRIKHSVIAYQSKFFDTNDLVYASKEKMDQFIQLIFNDQLIENNRDIVSDVVQKISEKLNQYNFTLSFTGYGFGALYAQLSLLFCHSNLNIKKVRAVTFESPGCENLLKLFNIDSQSHLNNFDIRTYLTTHNFVNTCGHHLGKVFSITNENIDLNSNNSIFNNIKISNIKEMFEFLNRFKKKEEEYIDYLENKAQCYGETYLSLDRDKLVNDIKISEKYKENFNELKFLHRDKLLPLINKTIEDIEMFSPKINLALFFINQEEELRQKYYRNFFIVLKNREFCDETFRKNHLNEHLKELNIILQSYRAFLNEMNNIFLKDQKYSFSIYMAFEVLDNLIFDTKELPFLSNVEDKDLKEINLNFEIFFKAQFQEDKDDTKKECLFFVYENTIFLKSTTDNYTKVIKFDDLLNLVITQETNLKFIENNNNIYTVFLEEKYIFEKLCKCLEKKIIPKNIQQSKHDVTTKSHFVKSLKCLDVQGLKIIHKALSDSLSYKNVVRVINWPYYEHEHNFCAQSIEKDLIIQVLKSLARSNDKEIIKKIFETNNIKYVNLFNDENFKVDFETQKIIKKDLFKKDLDLINNPIKDYLKTLLTKKISNILISKCIIDKLNYLYGMAKLHVDKNGKNLVLSRIQIDDLIEKLTLLLDLSQRLKDIFDSN